MTTSALRFTAATLLTLTCAMTPSPAQSETPTLPDPLLTRDGRTISTAADWDLVRKPELRDLFEQLMYGRYPAKPQRITSRTLFENKTAFDGHGTLREIEITVGPPPGPKVAQWPKIYLLLATPHGDKPAACFVGANFGGNHLRVDDPRVRVPKGYGNAGSARRGQQRDGWDIWPLEETVARGYAVATFFCGDVQPDNPDMQGGMAAAAAQSSEEPDPTAPGAIMWWAWGIHRAVDYLVTDPTIDSKRIAVIGHSRLGKAALVAGAFDDRIALTIPHQAGCGGSGPSRHDDKRAETVKIIVKAFPHWFCDNFDAFAEDPAELPFDQNCLVALCAPRPVLFTSAAEDLWSNPSGQFAVLKAATPVYELLGVEGLNATEWPQAGDPLIKSRLGYWIRPGKHALTPVDWQTFMDFADVWLSR